MDFMIQANTILPPEIVTIILSKYAKNGRKCDLLKFRLISKSWNLICMSLLEESGHTRALHNGNITNFLQFVNSLTKEALPQLILPFDLQLSNSHLDENICESLNQFSEEIQELTNSHSGCVINFTVNYFECCTEDVFLVFIKLLAKISIGLVTLDLSNFHFKMNIANVNGLIETQNLTFPNVRKLKCNSGYSNPSWNGPFRPFHSILIQLCPNLKELEIFERLKLELSTIQVIPFEQIQTLKIYDLISIPSISVRNMIDEEPVLEKLYFKNGPLTSYFVGLFSSSLKSLTLGLNSHYGTVPLRFPLLPNLRILKLKRLTPSIPYCILRDSFPVSSFPRLETIELPSGCFLAPNLESLDGFDEVLSPTVCHFKLRVNNCNIEGSCASLQDYLKHLHKSFPNVSKYTVIGGNAEEEQMYHVIRGIMNSPGAQMLEEIELKNCTVNYIGEILEETMESNILGHGLSNLRKLWITVSDKYAPKLKESGGLRKKLFLNSTLKYLKDLNEIHISQHMVDSMKDQDKHYICMDEITKANAEFSNVCIKLV